MSREIRRVPANWEHPKFTREEWNDKHTSGVYGIPPFHKVYKPLYDETFEHAARQWLIDAIAWDFGTHPDLLKNSQKRGEYPFYWQVQMPPDPEVYRPQFDGPATHYQIYETVSEGTPVSPVFASEEEMVEWLCTPRPEGADMFHMQGLSLAQAVRFVADGASVSTLVTKDGWVPGFREST